MFFCCCSTSNQIERFPSPQLSSSYEEASRFHSAARVIHKIGSFYYFNLNTDPSVAANYVPINTITSAWSLVIISRTQHLLLPQKNLREVAERIEAVVRVIFTEGRFQGYIDEGLPFKDSFSYAPVNIRINATLQRLFGINPRLFERDELSIGHRYCQGAEKIFFISNDNTLTLIHENHLDPLPNGNLNLVLLRKMDETPRPLKAFLLPNHYITSSTLPDDIIFNSSPFKVVLVSQVKIFNHLLKGICLPPIQYNNLEMREKILKLVREYFGSHYPPIGFYEEEVLLPSQADLITDSTSLPPTELVSAARNPFVPPR